MGNKVNRMKKVILLFVALFVATIVNAQDVCVGPKFGYQTAKLSFKGSHIKQDFKNDMTFGMFARFTYPKFILQPEILYSFNARNCINIPVYFGYKLVDNKNLKMRANAGPVLFYNTMKGVTGGRLTLGGSLGLGVDVWRFTADLNYSLGATNYIGLISTSKANQNVFTLTFGFKLRY